MCHKALDRQIPTPIPGTLMIDDVSISPWDEKSWRPYGITLIIGNEGGGRIHLAHRLTWFAARMHQVKRTIGTAWSFSGTSETLSLHEVDAWVQFRENQNHLQMLATFLPPDLGKMVLEWARDEDCFVLMRDCLPAHWGVLKSLIRASLLGARHSENAKIGLCVVLPPIPDAMQLLSSVDTIFVVGRMDLEMRRHLSRELGTVCEGTAKETLALMLLERPHQFGKATVLARSHSHPAKPGDMECYLYDYIA